MIGPFGGRLPGHRLPDDRQRGQGDQAGQHVPADDLRMDRGLHRVGGLIKVGGAVHVRRAEPAVEAGQVGGPVRQSHVVGPQQGHALIERRGVRGRGVEVVVRAAAGGELALGGDDAHHPQRRTQSRGRLALARFQLCLRDQLRPEDRADAYAVVPGQGEGRQHLTGVRLAGHPPGQERDHPRQLTRWYLVDQEVNGVDRLAAGRAANGSVDGHRHRRCRGNVRQRAQLRQLLLAVHDDVVAMPRREVGERVRRPVPGGRRGQDESAGYGDEQAKRQPRLPVLPGPRPEDHDDGLHGHLPFSSIPGSRGTGRIAKEASYQRCLRVSTTVSRSRSKGPGRCSASAPSCGRRRGRPVRGYTG